MKKLAAIVTVAAMTLSLFAGMNTEAAAKPALSENKMSLTVGTSKILKVKKAKKTKTVIWSVVTGKGKVILKNKKKSSVKVVAKKTGKAKVQAKVGKKKLVCTVTVKEKKKETQAPVASQSAAPPNITSPSVAPPTTTSPPVSTESPDEQALKAFVADQRAKGATISGNIHDPKEYTWDSSGKKLIGIFWHDEKHANDKGLQGELSFSAFSDLEKLTVHHNTEVTKIDVTGNLKLKSLSFADTAIETIDVSKNTELEVLECYFNELYSLDVTHNPKLRVLNCGSNQIDELDLSQNKDLEELDCCSNWLEELDWTNNVKLTSLSCGNNTITTVDVSMLPDLEYLACEALKRMEALDVSANHKMKIVTCTACDMLNTLIVNPEIEEIYIDGIPIKIRIDASQCLTTPTVHAGEGQEYELIPPTSPAA